MREGTQSRMMKCQGKVFRDQKSGKAYEGVRIITLPNPNAPDGVDSIEVWYRKGKIHREQGHAVSFPDGHKEAWRDGMFVAVMEPAYQFRAKPF